MASTYLQRTGISAGNRRTWTFSAWVKRNGLGEQRIFNHEQASGTSNISVFKWDGSNKLLFADAPSGSNVINLNSSNMVFRDVNAWYHLVLRVDTTQATATDRTIIYVNGEDLRTLSGFSTYTSCSQNHDTFANQSGNKITIGAWVNNTTQYFDGSMAHVHFCDGYSYAPTEFGSTDSTTGIWKPKTSPSVSYGTNGFFLDMADSSDMGNDISGNNNDFTVNNTITQTIDTPSNVFCTLNPLSTAPVASSSYFSNGNTVFDAPSVSPYDISCGSTLGVSKGKYYWEVKWVIDGGGSQAAGIGIYESDQQIDNFGNMRTASGKKNVIWDLRHDLYVNGSDTGNDYTAASGDIVGLALDLDNGTLKIHKNGTYFNSGNAVTTAIDTSKTYLLLASPNGGSNHSTLSFNFGNGYFGTTAVSSAGTNSGIGTFEYDVPSGYKALCTKNINAQEYS
jgi:hypothetical protein